MNRKEARQKLEKIDPYGLGARLLTKMLGQDFSVMSSSGNEGSTI